MDSLNIFWVLYTILQTQLSVQLILALDDNNQGRRSLEDYMGMDMCQREVINYYFFLSKNKFEQLDFEHGCRELQDLRPKMCALRPNDHITFACQSWKVPSPNSYWSSSETWPPNSFVDFVSLSSTFKSSLNLAPFHVHLKSLPPFSGPFLRLC